MILSEEIVDQDKLSIAREYIKSVSARISSWIDILGSTYSDYGLGSACFDDLVRMSYDYDDLHLKFCQRRQESACMYLMSCLKGKIKINAKTCYELGTSETLFIEDRSTSDHETSYYTTHFGSVCLVRKNRRRVTDITSNNKKVLKLVMKYEKYQRASANTMDIDVKVNLGTCCEKNGSLYVGDGQIMIGGFIGVPSERPTSNVNFITKPDGMDDVSFNLLKSYLIRDQTGTPDIINSITTDKNVLFKGMRYIIYSSMNSSDFEPFLRSTEVRNDIMVPTKETMESETLDFDGLDDMDFLEKIADVGTEMNKLNEELGDEEEEDDLHHYFELYGENAAELIPGVDYLEISRKTKFNMPSFMKDIQKQIELVEGSPRTLLNTGLLDLLDKMQSENDKDDGSLSGLMDFS
jgi:hypothetical protein